MLQMFEFAMWMLLFASIMVSFCTLLLEFVLNDTTEYDMEFLWNNRYSLEELELSIRKK